MQVTINIPDSIAEQAAQRGLSPEIYSEQLIRQQGDEPSHDRVRENRIDVERFLREFPLAGLPVLPDRAFTREAMYDDHD